MASAKTKVLFVDNFDSFTYNLVDEFGLLPLPLGWHGRAPSVFGVGRRHGS